MKKFLFILSMTALLALQANAETLLGDLNGDNEVNITDVNLLIEAISTGNGEANFDLNGDGSINITDLSILLEIAMAIDPEPDFEIDGEHATGWWNLRKLNPIAIFITPLLSIMVLMEPAIGILNLVMRRTAKISPMYPFASCWTECDMDHQYQ